MKGEVVVKWRSLLSSLHKPVRNAKDIKLWLGVLECQEHDHYQGLKAARLKNPQKVKPLSNQNHKSPLQPNPQTGQLENQPELISNNPHLILPNSHLLLLRKLIPPLSLHQIATLRTPPSNRALPCFRFCTTQKQPVRTGSKTVFQHIAKIGQHNSPSSCGCVLSKSTRCLSLTRLKVWYSSDIGR